MSDVKNKYKATVIVPTYNRSKLLDYTLNSIYLQDIPRDDFEVVVADDGSSDNTLEVVNSYQSKLNLKYEFQEDLGYRPASARNLGILASEAEVCIFIDAGVIINSNCIREHIKFHQEKGSVAAIGYVFGFDQGDGMIGMLKKMIDPYKPQESMAKLGKNRMFIDVRDYHYITYHDQLQDLPAPWLYFWTCHISATRENILRVGLFDERYNGKWGCEDNDLGFRLHHNGAPIHLLRAAEALHIPHHEDFEEKKKQGHENCAVFNNKFQTLETQLFLDTYLNEIFTDINAMSIHCRLKEKV